MKTRWQEYKEKNGVTPLDLLNPQTKPAEDMLAQERLNICLGCEHLIQKINQCKKCGCFMNIKVKLEAAKCPEKKW